MSCNELENPQLAFVLILKWNSEWYCCVQGDFEGIRMLSHLQTASYAWRFRECRTLDFSSSSQCTFSPMRQGKGQGIAWSHAEGLDIGWIWEIEYIQNTSLCCVQLERSAPTFHLHSNYFSLTLVPGTSKEKGGPEFDKMCMHFKTFAKANILDHRQFSYTSAAMRYRYDNSVSVLLVPCETQWPWSSTFSSTGLLNQIRSFVDYRETWIVVVDQTR